MSECQHHWEMTNIRYGFISFDKCFHCNSIRTFFSEGQAPDMADEYRQGACFWDRVEDAQSLRFDLQCTQCGQLESFRELLGLMHCTECLEDCEVAILQKRYQAQKTWVLVAFGFLPRKEADPLSPSKLEILSDYFNQRRDTTRSRIRILSFALIPDLSRCRGDFIHDVGMLSPEPVFVRKPLL